MRMSYLLSPIAGQRPIPRHRRGHRQV